jgi:isoaspartyl peptidase/L-asparaginase-like protein (Ntn-hydrolase superfamily)
MSKMLGRNGDSPLIRFGTYTCGACAVSGTLKWDMATVMEYKGLPLQQVVDYYVRDMATVMEYKGLPLQQVVDYYVRGTMQNIRSQLLSIISRYKLFTNLY